MIKKIISITAALLVIVSCLPCAFADDAISVGINEVVVLTYDTATETGGKISKTTMEKDAYMVHRINVTTACEMFIYIRGKNVTEAGYSVEVDGVLVDTSAKFRKDYVLSDYAKYEFSEGEHTIKLTCKNGTLEANYSKFGVQLLSTNRYLYTEGTCSFEAEQFIYEADEAIVFCQKGVVGNE